MGSEHTTQVVSAQTVSGQGLEGAEDFPLKGTAGLSLVASAGLEMVGSVPLSARWCDPCFSHQRGQQVRQAPAGVMAACLLVHAEASCDPRARPERGRCRRTSEFHGQSFTSQNQDR